jgi:hypothetical protein
MNKQVFKKYMDYFLGDAEDFEVSDTGNVIFCIRKNLKIGFWVGNGIFSYGLYNPIQIQFSLLQKIKFHFYYLPKWKTKKALVYFLDNV